ncbi:MAG: MFS transporter [Victivallaceae bacterium]|nr:MFS transporter [Victivallaceae bacterium]
MQNLNLKYYYAFFCFNGITLAVAGNPLFFDKILIEMKIDLSAFGWIKGLSLFLGAFGCLLVSHLLEKFGREREVVIAGYGIRGLLPLLIIVSTLFFQSKLLLAWIVLIDTSLCYFFAIAANNSLDVLLKEISPAEKLSKNVALASSLNSLSCGAFAVLMSLILGGLEKKYSFVFVYCTLLLICASFHIPASLSLLKVKVARKEIDKKMKIFDILIPMKDKNYLRILGITLNTYIFWGGLNAYLFPYFLKVVKAEFSYLVIFGLLMSALAIFFSGKWGEYCEKYGHRLILNIAVSGVMFSLCLLFSESVIAVFIFSLVTWGGAGLFASGLAVGQRSLYIQKSCRFRTNIYIASASLFGGIGFFTGNFAASVIFSAAREIYPSINDATAYHCIFGGLLIPCLGILVFNNFKMREQ